MSLRVLLPDKSRANYNLIILTTNHSKLDPNPSYRHEEAAIILLRRALTLLSYSLSITEYIVSSVAVAGNFWSQLIL